MKKEKLDYSRIRLATQEVFYNLRKAGYEREADAVSDLINIIGNKIETDVNANLGPVFILDREEDFIDNCNNLINYINEELSRKKIAIDTQEKSS